MTRQATVPQLTDEQMVRRLEEAQVEDREDRLVGCSGEAELRELLGTLRHPT